MHLKAKAVKSPAARPARSVCAGFFLRNRWPSEPDNTVRRAIQKSARTARQPDIAMLVPPHGAPLAGPAIGQVPDRVELLPCGTVPFDGWNHQPPTARISA